MTANKTYSIKGGSIMLIIQGYFENGIFTPNEPVFCVKGRQAATLTIQEIDKDIEKQEYIKNWTEILEDLQNNQEELLGEPDRIHFKTPEEVDSL